jgi:hypothetical protein
MVLAILMRPSAFLANLPVILLILIPCIVFIWLIVTRPEVLFVDNLFYRRHKDEYSIDHQWNMERADRQQEVDRILDKINRSGMKSLSRRERDLLNDYSKKGR